MASGILKWDQSLGNEQELSAAEHNRFFTAMLGDIDEPTLPFGLSDVSFDRTEINETHLMLSQTLTDKLRLHAQNLHVSLASICHVSWAMVLARASRCDKVVFGTVLLGRLQTGKEHNNTMGPMGNTLPIRIDIDENNVETAVRHTHALLSALLTHEYAPLVLAERCSGVPVGLPLFSSLLNYRHSSKTDQETALLEGVSVIDAEERINYPLLLSVEDDGDSLCLTTRIVSPMTAYRVSAYMQQALESLADALTRTPHQPIQKLAVIPAEERMMLLHDWNPTTIPCPSARCLHELFEAQVECNGQAIAVEFNGVTLSYNELNVQANRLAHYLIKRGVKPDDLIGLCVDRSITMIVAILGILKAGGAYVPLDPVYSSQRLTTILLDADPKILLADAMGRNSLGNHDVPVVNLDESLPEDLSTKNPNATRLGLTPNHLAYVIYTSGSTGKPKGVMVEHRAVITFIQAQDQFGLNKDDKFCLFSSFSFDFSVVEIWGAISNGGQLAIIPYELARSANDLYDWICANEITVLYQTPLAFKTLMRVSNIRLGYDRLRYMFFGGEAIDSSTFADWCEINDKRKNALVHLYGPTETVVLSTSWICETTVSENLVVSIGRPFNDKRIYLLDAYGEPVPLGAEGEIYIGGTSLARGYLNRPDLTAERFLSDPFSDNPGARMYRTGDRARYLPDGNLVYLGRTDHQVKIRGFRIELGEIEAHLVEHPQVHEAVVQIYGNGLDARLIAYVVADADTNTFLAGKLRTYLSDLLPHYMVPSAYVCLQSLPLTPNGKLDRRALPAPDDDAFARQEYEAPQNETEEKLAQIWRELLGIEQISRHDNFFALGGHSLLVVEMLAQSRQYGLDTSVQKVFDASTLAMLASELVCYEALNVPPNMITEDSKEITPAMLPLINLSQAEIDSVIAQVPGGIANIQDIYGLTPIQHGMLFHHVKAESGDPYLLVSRMQFSNRAALETYVSSWEQVIQRHDILRTVFIWKDLNEPAQVVLRKIPSILTEIILDATDADLLKQLTSRYNLRHYRLDLTQAPLLRLVASPRSDEKYEVLQIMHHTIADHLTEEMLEAEFRNINNGQFEKLESPTSFRHLVALVRLGAGVAEHKRFFTAMLGDIDEPTLPFGLSDVSLDNTDINETHMLLTQTLNNELRAHARNLHVSLATICHLAWAMVIARSSGCVKVVYGTVLLGRSQTGKENNNIMGPMINTLPIRIDIDEKSVTSAVHHTHAQLSALLAHEHAPLILAQRCSGVPVGLPLFSSILNYRHNVKKEEGLRSIAGVTFIDYIERTNYPLVLSVEDDGDSLSLTPQIISSMSTTRISDYMQQALKSLDNALKDTTHQPIQKLTVVPMEERMMLLHDWNPSTVPRASARCLHELFESQVKFDGKAIAVKFDDETLSYNELNIKANRLAHYLIRRGVKPDDLIALCVDRSITMIVAILGILKAGCAYVPLDPVYSSQRLTTILLDADPKLLLADAMGRKSLGDHNLQMVDLDELLPEDLSTENPNTTRLGLTSHNLAYVIYTSGSTGKPKGVMVEHKEVVTLMEVTQEKFGFKKQDRWCLFSSFSFDFSVYEIWGALMNGGQLSIISYELTRSTNELYDWICTNAL